MLKYLSVFHSMDDKSFPDLKLFDASENNNILLKRV